MTGAKPSMVVWGGLGEEWREGRRKERRRGKKVQNNRCYIILARLNWGLILIEYPTTVATYVCTVKIRSYLWEPQQSIRLNLYLDLQSKIKSRQMQM